MWSRENLLEFIEIYKQHSVLWNPKDPYHYDRIKKSKAWEQISHEIGRPVDDCKRKMDYLLSGLRREKSKMKRRKGIIKDDEYQSSWYCFDSLKFLLDKHTSCQTLNIAEGDQSIKQETECDDTEYYTDQYIEADTESTSNEMSPTIELPTPSVLSRKRRATKEDQRLDQAFEIFKSSCEAAIDDCQIFGNMVEVKLRSFSEVVRTKIQIEILEIFLKAGNGFYDFPTKLSNHYTPEAAQASSTVSSETSLNG